MLGYSRYFFYRSRFVVSRRETHGYLGIGSETHRSDLDRELKWTNTYCQIIFEREVICKSWSKWNASHELNLLVNDGHNFQNHADPTTENRYPTELEASIYKYITNSTKFAQSKRQIDEIIARYLYNFS